VLLIPQAFVSNEWQLVGLRFLMGIALGGLLPCIAAIIRHSVPDIVAGRMLGYSTSSQYVGQVLGPLTGGYLGGHFGMPIVFIVTCVLMVGVCAGDAGDATGNGAVADIRGHGPRLRWTA
jgi:MFS family permease